MALKAYTAVVCHRFGAPGCTVQFNFQLLKQRKYKYSLFIIFLCANNNRPILTERYTFIDTPFGRRKVPFASGTEYRVVCGGIMAGSIRSLIETPLEYAKVNSESSPESRSLLIFFFGFRYKDN